MLNMFKKKPEPQITECARCKSTNLIGITTTFIGILSNYDTKEVVTKEPLLDMFTLHYKRCNTCAAITYNHYDIWYENWAQWFEKESEFLDDKKQSTLKANPKYSDLEIKVTIDNN